MKVVAIFLFLRQMPLLLYFALVQSTELVLFWDHMDMLYYKKKEMYELNILQF